jgi:hypothetical protein
MRTVGSDERAVEGLCLAYEVHVFGGYRLTSWTWCSGTPCRQRVTEGHLVLR